MLKEKVARRQMNLQSVIGGGSTCSAHVCVQMAALRSIQCHLADHVEVRSLRMKDDRANKRQKAGGGTEGAKKSERREIIPR